MNNKDGVEDGLSAIYERDENRKLLFSYALAKRDIKTAKAYLKKTQDTSFDYYERNVNLLTLYIIYGRIFSKNFDLPTLDIKKIKCEFTKDEQNLHKSLIHLRNKIFAHSDASMNHIQICLDENGKLTDVPSHNTTLIEKYHDIGVSLFDKILAFLEENIKELLEYLYSQNNGYKITDENYVLLGFNNDFFENYHKKRV